MARVEQQLYHAIWYNHDKEAVALLRAHPDLDVNWKDQNGWTALHQASSYWGHLEVVKLLLDHPFINVNVQTNAGATPFLLCCSNRNLPVVQVLLKDPRVDITLATNSGRTPLWDASCSGFLEVIEWRIASGRDLGDFNLKEKHWDEMSYTALEIAKDRNNTEVVSLLERFLANPQLVCHQLRVKLGMLDEMASEIFALVVFACDGLLQLKSTSVASVTSSIASRFFTIAARLPMELQMILCNTVVGSTKQTLLRKDSEPAFKSLARSLLLSQDQ
jgi:hypothetical protein